MYVGCLFSAAQKNKKLIGSVSLVSCDGMQRQFYMVGKSEASPTVCPLLNKSYQNWGF